MGDRDAKLADVVRAATQVFLRYGFSRSTMGDIAAASGVSRPALYLLFPSKEDVFAAVIRAIDADWHAAVRDALAKKPSLEAKLRHACDQWAAHGIDLITTYPDAKDLFDLSVGAVREMYQHFQELIATLIEPAIAHSRVRATADELARNLVYALRGIKDSARSTSDMRRLADVQVSLLIAALAIGESRRPPRRAHKARASRSP